MVPVMYSICLQLRHLGKEKMFGVQQPNPVPSWIICDMHFGTDCLSKFFLHTVGIFTV